MKIHRYLKLFLLVLLSVTMPKCNYIETDFGFDGSIKGVVKDNNGTPLYGDINSNTIVIKFLGDGDQIATYIRVNGDGTFQNIKMYPKFYQTWVEGPIVFSDTVLIDFSQTLDHIYDFTVTPLILPKIINGTADGTSINIEYSIVPTGAVTISKKEVYCSTIEFPTAAIGSRANMYTTKTVSLSALSGNTIITGLVSGTKYYLRIGALASSSKVMNYSNQIEITIP